MVAALITAALPQAGSSPRPRRLRGRLAATASAAVGTLQAARAPAAPVVVANGRGGSSGAAAACAPTCWPARATAARAGSGARSAGCAAPAGASRWLTTWRTVARAAGPVPTASRAPTACAATLNKIR